MTGSITEPTGAGIPRAQITIMNAETGAIRTLTSDKDGNYVAKDLGSGRYTVRVESPGFRVGVRTGIALQAGNCERINVSLGLEIGMCEVVAVELPAEVSSPENLYEKKKPFNYVVGERKDGGRFQGIAKLVYGDPKAWVQIFEANRSVLLVPGPIPYGTAIYVPARKRVIPKLISKVTPVYPRSGGPGEVVLDVTLAGDGAVKWVGVIVGDRVLAEGPIFRPIDKTGRICNRALGTQTIYNIVRQHVPLVDAAVRPHDLRRSFARMAYENHAAIEQLSITLGHSSISTTERYIGAKQNFRLAPCDLVMPAVSKEPRMATVSGDADPANPTPRSET